MKVLFINTVVDYGSTGKIVRDLANGLKEKGHEVRIAYGRYSASYQEDTFSIVDKKATYWHVLMTRLLGRHGLHSKRATKKLISFIEEFEPDVIHMHNLHGYYLNVPMLLSYLEKKDIKLLLTLHDQWTFSGSSASFDYYGCKVWDKGCKECNSTSDYPQVKLYAGQQRNFRWKEKYFTNLNNLLVITPSEWLTNLTKKTFLNIYEIKTIYNGIDTNVFYPKYDQLEDIGDDDIVLLGVSSVWEERKGIKIFEELSMKLDEKYKLVLIGLDKQQIKELPDNIIKLSRTANMQELVKYYTRADVFINPTLEEAFGLTSVEANACGTKAIIFSTGGAPETINEQTGWLTNERTVQSLYEIINENITTRQPKSMEAVEHVREKFEKSKMIKNYINEMERLYLYKNKE